MHKVVAKVASTLFLIAIPAQAATFNANPAKSEIQWKGWKVLVDSSHTGKIAVQSGKLDMEGDALKSGEVVVDMKSIVDEDLKDKEKNGKLVGHLKSEDFFDVEKFPTAKLVITSAKSSGPGKFALTGNMTLKGKTEPVNMDATLNSEGDSKALVVDFKFDRSKWDVRYGSGKFFKGLGDKVISDDIALKTKIVFDKSGK